MESSKWDRWVPSPFLEARAMGWCLHVPETKRHFSHCHRPLGSRRQAELSGLTRKCWEAMLPPAPPCLSFGALALGELDLCPPCSQLQRPSWIFLPLKGKGSLSLSPVLTEPSWKIGSNPVNSVSYSVWPWGPQTPMPTGTGQGLFQNVSHSGIR